MSAVVSPEVRVRYADTDRMGYAYYANYLVWFEVGRNEWMRAQGLPYVDVEADGYILPVVSADVKYHRPALYDDLLRVETQVAPQGRAQVRFSYEVRRDQELVVTGSTVHVCTTPQGRVLRLPSRIARLLGGSA